MPRPCRSDEGFWSEAASTNAIRLQAATMLKLAGPDLPGASSACRLVFSEADGLSGLVVDRYGDWLSVQLTSLALAARRDLLTRLLQRES